MAVRGHLKPVIDQMATTKEGGKLDPRYIQRMVKRYAAKAGIEKDITPHTLRHSFATDLYRETSKIRLVQKVLGHSDLSTTMIYTHIFDEEVESALKSFRQATAVAMLC
jgi:integrase/recombinase XerD